MNNGPPVVITPRSFHELKRLVVQLRSRLVSLGRRLANIPNHRRAVYKPSPLMHRGLTNEAISKGTSDKMVSRYSPGTTTDSGTDDTVTNELINIGSGKVVHYFESGGVFYITSVECPNT